MAAGDTTACSTPIWERANPYGPFDLDMTARLAVVVNLAAGDTSVGSTPTQRYEKWPQISWATLAVLINRIVRI
jgi:hypothetical protein